MRIKLRELAKCGEFVMPQWLFILYYWVCGYSRIW